uniref:Putative secreted protein n=1 Tax=Anopheles darlingi TaxID=43151 RepID=A0A2M4D946_ANODA
MTLLLLLRWRFMASAEWYPSGGSTGCLAWDAGGRSHWTTRRSTYQPMMRGVWWWWHGARILAPKMSGRLSRVQ